MARFERFTRLAVAALAAGVWLIVPPARAEGSPRRDAPSEEAAVSEVLAFYRDLAASNWTAPEATPRADVLSLFAMDGRWKIIRLVTAAE